MGEERREQKVLVKPLNLVMVLSLLRITVLVEKMAKFMSILSSAKFMSLSQLVKIYAGFLLKTALMMLDIDDAAKMGFIFKKMLDKKKNL